MKTMKFGRTALVIALAMTIILSVTGGTIAWFTDEVSSTGNKIEAGTLDLALFKLENDTWKDISDETGYLFNYDLWEPGYTTWQVLKVKNEGTLALKWKAEIITDGEVSKLADAIDVYVKVGAEEGPDTRDLEAAGWTFEATLADFIKNAETKTVGNLAAGAEATLGIALKMREEAGNEYQGLTLGNFDIKIVATQDTVETDSFGDDYDANALFPVHNVDELGAALVAGKSVKLEADIEGVDANTAITIAAGKTVTLDLNGHKIVATANKTGNQELFLVKGNMTVKNGDLKLTAENNQAWGAMATIFDVTAGGVLNMEGVTANVSGTDMNFVVHLNNWGEATLNMNNCDITTTYVGVRAFNSGYDMNNVTIKNTDFHTGRVFWVHNYTSEGKDDSTLNLDIYGNGNTTDNAKPVRFGFSIASYYDIDGNLIP